MKNPDIMDNGLAGNAQEREAQQTSPVPTPPAHGAYGGQHKPAAPQPAPQPPFLDGIANVAKKVGGGVKKMGSGVKKGVDGMAQDMRDAKNQRKEASLQQSPAPQKTAPAVKKTTKVNPAVSRTAPNKAVQAASAERPPANGATQVSRPVRAVTEINPVSKPSEEAGAATAVRKAVKPEGSGGGGGGKKRRKSAVASVVSNVFKTLFVMLCFVAIGVSIFIVNLSLNLVESTADDGEILNLETLRQNQNQNSNIVGLNPDNLLAEIEDDFIAYQELIGDENREWVDLARMPKHLKDGVMAIEDLEFETHHGFNLKRTILSAANELFGFYDFQMGGSTIDQQLIKNITKDDDVSIERKVREIYRAWGMNNRYSKPMILEAYLNTMSLSERLKGVQAGAKDYFGKNVEDLDLAECATIAGITQSPGKYSPNVNPEASLKRRNHVLGKMLEAEFITQAEHDEAVAQPFNIVQKEKVDEEQMLKSEIYSYFTDTVIEEVARDMQEINNMTREEAIHAIYSEGLTIYATVDIKMQAILDEMYEHGFEEGGYFAKLQNPSTGRYYMDQLAKQQEKLGDDGKPILDEDGKPVMETVYAQSAISVLDYKGALKGVAGGIQEKKQNLGLNRATQSPRQTGSSMKAVAAYPLGIDRGLITFSSGIRDSAVIYSPGFPGSPGTPNWPQNYSRSYSNARIPVVSAIASSLNTVATRVGQMVTVQAMYDFMINELEISTLDPVRDMDFSPLVLGSLTNGITTYEMAGAYQMYGNGGEFNSVHCYSRVEDVTGAVILEPDVVTYQAISEATGYIMNRALKSVLFPGIAPSATGTASGMYPRGGMESAAKTGTTDNHKDRWIAALTPYYVTAIWWGYDSTFFLNWSISNGNVPVRIWRDLMERVQDGMPHKEFPEQPSTVVTQGFCTITGDLASAGCPTATGYYNTEYMDQTPVCGGHAGEIPDPANAPPPAP